ncbi:LysR family transcriptional regulator [Sphingomonas sp.]|uniref:LysR substrate-binding domain-containing protein n=1 Tax=Sphingomonas sp. TaxID=28214 RepID=UPI000DB5DCC8|nr:LysR family transcriptional regulator [Sphingomonas sp.]PZU10750.1 MAG: hypothetical protein DI605_03650 [Sphingomonas sp.]
MTSSGPSGTRARSRRPEFRQLETFLKVVETRSFAAAARQLGSTQPAVSQAIARLEEIVGADLFERRRGAPVGLTPTGRAILPSARSLLHTIDQQMVRAVATAQSRSGSLTIGFYPGLVSGPLRDGITAFAADRPDVGLRLVEAFPHELHRQLNDRLIDLMFVTFLPDLTSTALVQETLWEERMIVALREDHQLAGKASLGWNDVSKLRIMMRSSESDRTSHHALLSRIGEWPLDCELHDVSRGAIFDMILMGLGTTICFQSAAIPRDGITYLPIADDAAVAKVEGVWIATDRNPIRHSFLTYVRKHI